MQNNIVEINEGFSLRGFQVDILKQFKDTRFLSLVSSRQVGKTVTGVQILLDFLFCFNKRENPSALVAMSTADQAYSVYFKRLMDLIKDIPEQYLTIQGSTSSGLMRITLRRPWLGDSVTVEMVGSHNLSAIKGRTCDLVILDELGFFHDPNCVTEIFLPILDDTDGKLYATSTVNGRNHWYDLTVAFDKMRKEGDRNYAHLKFDVHACRVRSKDWIESKKRYYENMQQLHIFNQEYLCDFDAAVSDEVPFVVPITEMLKRKKPENLWLMDFNGNKVIYNKTVNVSIDIGTLGNNAAFEWVSGPKNEVHILNYKADDENQYALIDRLVKKYSGHTLNLIYPADVSSPSVMEGRTMLDLLLSHIVECGYSRLVNVQVLEKTKSRKALLQRGLDMLHITTIEEEPCREGIEMLLKTRLKKDKKTGYVDPANFVKNGAQHVADALCYIAAARDNLLKDVMVKDRSSTVIRRPIKYKGFGGKHD